ncbi:MAG: hypothetical protein O2809_02785 [Proteobacteria bacterium]|nr:hypothetical protein [Pseudomonadota bacterium]
MKRIGLKTIVLLLTMANIVGIGHADIRSCMKQFTYIMHTIGGDQQYNCVDFTSLGYIDYCTPHLYDCVQAEINANTQNAINNANTQVGNLTGRYNIDLGNINTRFTNDEAAINNNHNNVLAQIQATNNSIAGTVTNTVNQQLPAQVSQKLPQVVQSQLTPELIAKGLQNQYQTAINTKFKANSGALYIRGFETTVDMDGQQLLNVYPVDTEHNFCAGTTSAEKLYASLYLTQKNASVIAAYLLSAYATGKPVVLETASYTAEGNYHCVIKNINASVDINSLKA